VRGGKGHIGKKPEKTAGKGKKKKERFELRCKTGNKRGRCVNRGRALREKHEGLMLERSGKGSLWF